MTGQPINPADIMAALTPDDRINLECLADALRATGKAGGAAWIDAALDDLDRLAEALQASERALTAEREKVWDECVAWFGTGHALPQWRVNQNVLLDAEEANPYRAALAGEGAADQPQGNP